MLRSLCICTVAALLISGCTDTQPDRREALKPEENEPRYPGLEINPPDAYEYMRTPAGIKRATGHSLEQNEAGREPPGDDMSGLRRPAPPR